MAFNDPFTRTSSTTLGSTPDGRPWTAHVGTWGTNGTQAYCVSANDNDHATVDSGVVNQDVSWPAQVIANGWQGVLVSYADPSNFVLAETDGTGVLAVYRRLNGVDGQIISNVTGTVTGDTLRIVRTNANQYTLYRNGTQVGQTANTLTELGTATRVGLRHGSSTGGVALRWDSISEATATAGGGVVAPFGAGWTVHSNTGAVDATKGAYFTQAGEALATADSGTTSPRVSAKAYGVRGIADNFWRLTIGTDPNNYFWLEVNNSGNIGIKKTIGGVFPTDWTANAASAIVSEGGTVEFARVNGNQFIAYYNGTQVLATDTAQTELPTASRVGISSGRYSNPATTMYFGDFQEKTGSPAPPPAVDGPTILRWEGGAWVRRKLMRRVSGAWVWTA